MKEVRSLSPEETEIFNQYYKAHYALVLNTAKKVVGDHSLAETIAQETFVTAWQNFERFQASPNPTGWLMKVMYNKCKQALSSRQRQLKHTAFVDNIENIAVQYDYESMEPTIPEGSEKKLLHRFYIAGYTLKELAAEQHVKPGAMKMRIKRAKEKLKAEIQKNS